MMPNNTCVDKLNSQSTKKNFKNESATIYQLTELLHWVQVLQASLEFEKKKDLSTGCVKILHKIQL